jgi:hypothetical protein
MTDREAVIDVFAQDLPESVRVMNAPAVTEEILFGREVIADKSELPPEPVYDRYERALDELVDEGVLNTATTLGEKVYGLTPEWQERRRQQALEWLRNRVTLVKRQADEALPKDKLPLEHHGEILETTVSELEEKEG